MCWRRASRTYKRLPSALPGTSIYSVAGEVEIRYCRCKFGSDLVQVCIKRGKIMPDLKMIVDYFGVLKCREVEMEFGQKSRFHIRLENAPAGSVAVKFVNAAPTVPPTQPRYLSN